MEAVFKICTQSRLTTLSDGACIGTNLRQTVSIRIPAPAHSTTAPPLLSAFRGQSPHTIMGALGSTGVGRTTEGVGQWPGVTFVTYNYGQYLSKSCALSDGKYIGETPVKSCSQKNYSQGD